MNKKNWSALNRDLSWSTKIYVLVVLLVSIGSFVFQAWTTNWVMTMLLTFAVVLLVEHFSIVSQRHPKSWRTFKWIVLLLVLALLLIASY